MKFDYIIVFGAGIIGSCYGALLSARNNVVMIDNKEIVDKINKKGISIITKDRRKFNPVAQTKLDKILPNTLILLTTKAHQTESAINTIGKLLEKNDVVLVLQNGLGNEEIVKKVVEGRAEVIRGIINSGAWEIEPGNFNLILQDTVLEGSSSSSTITQIFNESGLPTRISQNFVSELWEKLILNCVVNPLTAILRVGNNQIGIPVLKNLRHRIVEECLKVAETSGVDLESGLSEKIDKSIQNYTNFSSMYQDVINGKKTEIDFLNGKIVELGRKHKIPTPCNEALYSIIKFLEPKNDIG